MHQKTLKIKTTTCLLTTTALAAAMAGCATKTPSAPPLTDQAAAYVEYARADMREDKVLMINQAMELQPTDPNYDAFWHEYYPYEAELKKINDERMGIIRDYEFSYDRMDDNTANNLAERALNIRKKRLALLEKYYKKIKEATSPSVAARFLQVENEIGLLVDIEIASQMPLLKKTP